MKSDKKRLTAADVPDDVYARYYLLHLFADVLSHYTVDLEEMMRPFGICIAHEQKKHCNGLLEATKRMRFCANNLASSLLVKMTDTAQNELFINSDSLYELVLLIIDRLMGERKPHTAQHLYNLIEQTFDPSGLFPELENDVSLRCRRAEGKVCDMFMSCPYAKSAATSPNGYPYAVYYCRGMWKECQRRIVRSRGGDYKNLSPDGRKVSDGSVVPLKRPKLSFALQKED